jgi:hypothetical protein
MTFYLLINHLLNFLAPAALLAFLLALCSRLFAGFFRAKDAPVAPWPVQAMVNFAIGTGVLMAGLLLFGRDGKILTYALLVLATAASQSWQSGGCKLPGRR